MTLDGNSSSRHFGSAPGAVRTSDYLMPDDAERVAQAIQAAVDAARAQEEVTR